MCRGASQFLWLRGCGATSPPFEEVGPPHVFEAASDGEQGVGARFRPAASRLFESAADDVLAGAFHDAGADRQSARPIEIVPHSVRVGFAVADCYYRIKTTQKCRSKIPQLGGCEFVPGGGACPPERKQSRIPPDFSAEGGSSRVIKLLYLNHDIAFPPPTLTKAGDGAWSGSKRFSGARCWPALMRRSRRARSCMWTPR